MAKELTAAVLKETYLANERRNLIRFAKAFADDPTVHIPKVYESHCSVGVLTMEYIDGLKIGPAKALKAQGVDPKLVARRGADFVLRQVFEMGFFHTDPHPGNFFILPGNVLAPIDFGQVAALPPRDRHLVNQIILALAGNEPRRIIKVLDREDMLDERTDVTRLTSEIEQLMEAYDHVSVWDVPFGQIITKVLDLFRIHHVRPPSQFTLMLKSLVTMESLAKSLDPDFNIMEVLTPYAERSVAASLSPKRLWEQVRDTLQRFGDLASRFPDDATTILRNLRQGKVQVRVHHEHLESLTKTLDKSSNRISFALIIAALLVGSSLLVPQEGKALGFISLQSLGVAGYIFATILGIWLVISIIRSGRL
jgi:ubiquinone biosynthesis protein